MPCFDTTAFSGTEVVTMLRRSIAYHHGSHRRLSVLDQRKGGSTKPDQEALDLHTLYRS